MTRCQLLQNILYWLIFMRTLWFYFCYFFRKNTNSGIFAFLLFFKSCARNLFLFYIIFLFVFSSILYSQSIPQNSAPINSTTPPTEPTAQEWKERVEQLEKQVRLLTDEVVELKKGLAVQQQATESISQNKDRQLYIYDDLIAQFEKEAPQNQLLGFYHQLIHTQAFIGGYLDIQVQEDDHENSHDWAFNDTAVLAVQWRTSWDETFAMQGELRLTQDKLYIAHAYFSATFQSWLALKAGILRVPYGRYNLNYIPPSLDLANIPISHQYIIPTTWSVPGISIFGQLNNGWLGYEVMLSPGLGSSRFDPKLGNQNAGWDWDNTSWDTKQITGRLELTPPFKLDTFAFLAGVSGLAGSDLNTHTTGYWGIATDIFLQIGPFTAIGDHDKIVAQAEWMQIDRFSKSYDSEMAYAMRGYYTEVSYSFFFESWREAVPFFTPETSLGAVVRWEFVNIHTRRISNSNYRIFTMGVFFRAIQPTILRLEYSRDLDDSSWDRIVASFATYF